MFSETFLNDRSDKFNSADDQKLVVTGRMSRERTPALCISFSWQATHALYRFWKSMEARRTSLLKSLALSSSFVRLAITILSAPRWICACTYPARSVGRAAQSFRTDVTKLPLVIRGSSSNSFSAIFLFSSLSLSALGGPQKF